MVELSGHHQPNRKSVSLAEMDAAIAQCAGDSTIPYVSDKEMQEIQRMLSL